MAQLTRKIQKVFGDSAGTNQRIVIGSYANGSTVYSTDPAVIQSLANYLEGFFSIVVGFNSPTIEDMNSICFLFAYQLTYLFQQGIPEWEVGTTYYIGSIVNQTGVLYKSIVDNNTGNAVTDTTKWLPFQNKNAVVIIDPATQSPYTMSVANDNGKVFLVNTANGAMQFNLPVASVGFNFTFKDKVGSADSLPITLHRNGSELLENLAADYIAESAYGEWTLACDGTNYSITGN